MEKKKYVVIGGGWSGLYALKYMLEENLDVRLYERESNIGGVWFYKEKESGVYKSTHVTSSKTYLHASDFPLPDEASNFPKHDQILAYLNDYTNHFNLWSYIHLNTHIIKIEQENNNRWKIKMKINENEIIEIYDGIIIATGQHQTANDLRHIEPFKNFTGTMSHSISYKQPDKDIFVNKTVLIVGGGETASDLAVELSAFTKQIYMSIRNGQWFQDRLFGDQPADILYPRSFSIFGYYNNIVLDIGWNLFIRPFWGEGGTGIDLWKPKSKLFHGFLNKSRDVISKIAFGLVIPKKGIRNINEQLVTFDDDDNKQIHIDHILFCTGYKWLHSFLDENIHQQVCYFFHFNL